MKHGTWWKRLWSWKKRKKSSFKETGTCAPHRSHSWDPPYNPYHFCLPEEKQKSKKGDFTREGCIPTTPLHRSILLPVFADYAPCGVLLSSRLRGILRCSGGRVLCGHLIPKVVISAGSGRVPWWHGRVCSPRGEWHRLRRWITLHRQRI